MPSWKPWLHSKSRLLPLRVSWMRQYPLLGWVLARFLCCCHLLSLFKLFKLILKVLIMNSLCGKCMFATIYDFKRYTRHYQHAIVTQHRPAPTNRRKTKCRRPWPSPFSVLLYQASVCCHRVAILSFIWWDRMGVIDPPLGALHLFRYCLGFIKS